jgi:hypothetical protein
MSKKKACTDCKMDNKEADRVFKKALKEKDDEEL